MVHIFSKESIIHLQHQTNSIAKICLPNLAENHVTKNNH